MKVSPEGQRVNDQYFTPSLEDSKDTEKPRTI